MSDETTQQPDENDEEPTAEGAIERGPAEVGPPEDIENDPAYEPEDPGLKGEKGG